MLVAIVGGPTCNTVVPGGTDTGMSFTNSSTSGGSAELADRATMIPTQGSVEFNI